MLRHYERYLQTKCQVISIAGTYVYPIFKVGYTCLMEDADMVFSDVEISACPETIIVLLRDPYARFQSGVDEYCKQNKKEFKDVYAKIKSRKLIDRHFMPQYLWLLHLYKWHKGKVCLKSFEYIKEITHFHRRANEEHPTIEPINNFIKVDRLLMNNINRTVPLEEIIRKYANVLS